MATNEPKDEKNTDNKTDEDLTVDKRKPSTTLQQVESKPVQLKVDEGNLTTNQQVGTTGIDPQVDEGNSTTNQQVGTTGIDPQMSNLAIKTAGEIIEKISKNDQEEREKQLNIFKEKYPNIDFGKCIFAED